ncbi:MAG: TlpA disulfide reductase family protein [Halieaceae bacterium]
MTLFRSIIILLLCLPLHANAGSLQAGQMAPLVDLPSLTESGENVSLLDLRGSVVYVDFWASWCGPCRVSFPQLETIRAELNEQGFEVLAINVDEYPEDAMKFLAEVPVSYPVVRDAVGTSPQAYGILGMPTGFLIDREGIVRKVHPGFRKSDGEKLRAEVIELLKE